MINPVARDKITDYCVDLAFCCDIDPACGLVHNEIIIGVDLHLRHPRGVTLARYGEHLAIGALDDI
ncbi:MAG: hypothetical protein KTR19_06685 [Hyphomicrobiales bacterium]|nr:hypothetical protein [Hyphomicrobiales bacterium]